MQLQRPECIPLQTFPAIKEYIQFSGADMTPVVCEDLSPHLTYEAVTHVSCVSAVVKFTTLTASFSKDF